MTKVDIMNKQINDYIYSKKSEILQNLAELVVIPSVKGTPENGAPFGNEPKNALLKMREICDKMGFKTTVYENAVLCADFGESPELGILAHLDVVPVQRENWHTNPFSLVEKDCVLYGRGVIDDKGPAVAALWALNAVKELGLTLKKGVRLIFGTDEENGSEDLEIYKKHDKFPPKVFTPDGSFPVINIEKGMIRSRFFGNVSGNIVIFSGGNIPNAVADKANAVLSSVSLETVRREIDSDKTGAEFSATENNGNVEIYCKGKAAHASTPQTGINAVTALISLINRICGNDVTQGLERLFPFGETDGSALGLKCADDSGALTAVFSKFSINDGVCEGTVDIRFPTCTNLVTVKDTLKANFEKVGLNYEMILGDEPHIVPENSEFVQKLLSVYEQIEGEKGKCIAIGGGTYVHNIDGGVAFGAERGDTDYNMHGDNEFITVDELLKDAILYANAIIEICG